MSDLEQKCRIFMLGMAALLTWSLKVECFPIYYGTEEAKVRPNYITGLFGCITVSKLGPDLLVLWAFRVLVFISMQYLICHWPIDHFTGPQISLRSVCGRQIR